ncbi:hypothetical protein [Microvirga sp. VF16]|uniref:hypothetical protein n=1 Tax=Microvirga sp. VF16 TaxID=2807101 RepID=UPI00193E5949|nr:hypothetical protein [Microvirga sp. VF16]QRM29559.1 hypothetical protein JO965_00550 [Microvirga sp. VF16]
MGGGSQKTTEYQKTDPWAGQQPYLKDAFAEAQQIYNSKKDSNGYSGNHVASYEPQDISGMRAVRDWAGTTGQGIIDTQAAGGQDLFSRGSQALTEVDRSLEDFAAKDWTATHIDNAGRYSNNPFMDAMVEASTRDAQRTFNEDTIRGINQNAATTGNTNSTRAGVAAGIAQRGVADFAGDTSATMRGDAWSTGLKMSQGDQQSILKSLMGDGGRGDLARDTVARGSTMMNDALANEAGVLGLQSSIAELLKGDKQSKLDNAMQKYEYKDTRRQSLLDKFYNIVGNKLWGSEGFSTSKTEAQPSAMSTAGSIIGSIGSLFRGK